MADGEDLSALDNWNPQKEDYEDEDFNSYVTGPGSRLPKSRQKPSGDRKETIQLYVRGIPNEMSDEGLKSLFSKAGNVLRAQKKKSKIDNALDTFGFVSFATVTEAEKACSELSGFQISENCTLSVQIAQSAEERARKAEQMSHRVASCLVGQDSGIATGSSDETLFKQKQITAPNDTRRTVPNDIRRTVPNDIRRTSMGGLNQNASPNPRRLSEPPRHQQGDVRHVARRSGPLDGSGDAKGARTSGKSPVTRPCIRCNLPGIFRCTSCKANYCSNTCQTEDWKNHKRTCKNPAQNSSDKENQEKDSMFENFVISVPGTESESEGPQIDARKARKIYAKDIGFVTLPSKEVMVQVQIVKSPTDFWVAIEDNLQLATGLLNEMTHHYAKASGTGYTPDKGELVAAKFSDNRWYRVSVDQVNGDATVAALFVDWGNYEQLSVNNLRILLPKFQKLHLQAVHCGLQVQPVNGEQWSDQDIKRTKGLVVPIDKSYTCKQLGKSADTCWVDLLDPNTSINVTAELVRHGSAKPMTKNDARQMRNTTQTPTTPAQGGKNAGSSSNNPVYSKSTKPPPPPSYPTVAKHLTKGQRTTINIVECKTPSLFWVHMPDNSEVKQLDQLKMSLNKHYGKMKPANGFRPPGHGLVAAKFSRDGGWYRCQVLDVQPTKIKVLYLDYGNQEDVDPRNLHSLESAFCSLPFQSVCCALAGIKSCEKEWTTKATDTFGRHAAGKSLRAEVVENYKDTGIVLLNIRLEDKSGTVNEAMIKAGVARCCENSEAFFRSETVQSPQPVEKKPPSSAAASRSLNASPPPPKLYDIPDGEVDVRVTDSQSFSKFYVQILDDKGKTMLMSIETILGEVFSTYASSYTPAVSEQVCARYSEDNNWYRAEVLSVQGTSYRVRFMDFGNEETVDSKSLAAMPTKLKEFPVLGIPCCFAPADKYEVKDGAWDPNLLAPFAKLYKMNVVDKLTTPISIKLAADNSDVLESLLQASILQDKPVKIMAKDIPKKPVDSGKEVVVCHIESPADLYVQSNDDSYTEHLTQILGLTEQLESQPAKPYTAEVGQMIAAKQVEADGSVGWYRAELLEQNEREAKVYFVDFGNYSSVTRDFIQVLHPCYADVPKLAIHCQLVGSEDAGEFSQDCINALNQIALNKMCGLKLHEKKVGSGGKEVLVVDLDLPEQKCATVSFLKDNNLWPSKRVMSIAKQIPLQELGNNELGATVVFAESPSDFYICVVSQMESNIDTLKNINDYCCNNSQVYVPQEGEYVIAYSAPYESWNRAQVVKIEDKQYLVRYVDFGNQELVNVDQIRALLEKFCQMTPLAYKCCVHGVQGTGEGGEWTSNAKQNFKSMESQPLLVQLIEPNSKDPYQVDLFTEGDKDGIAKRLIEVELAVPIGHAPVSSRAAPAPQATRKAASWIVKTDWRAGEKVAIKIPSLTDVDVFYAFPATEEWFQLVARMSEAMQVFGAGLNAQGPENFKAKMGDLCAALFDEDKQWYRSRVTGRAGGKLQVQYIDYGNKAEVSLTELHPLPYELQQVAPLCISFKLHGLQAKKKKVPTATLR